MRPNRQDIEQRNQILRRQMDAAARNRAPQSSFIAKAVNVDVATECIHRAAAVPAQLESFQPQDAMDNRTRGQPLPGQPDRLAVPKDGADRLTAADFFGDPMQPEWRPV